jgi:hypothetical protein
MKICDFRFAPVSALLAAAWAVAGEPPPDQPISPGAQAIRLFNGKDLTGLYTWWKGPGRNRDPQRAFTVLQNEGSEIYYRRFELHPLSPP